MVVEECSEKSSPGLDVRSLVAKSGPGKQSLYFVLKSKGGILVKAFFPFISAIFHPNLQSVTKLLRHCTQIG